MKLKVNEIFSSIQGEGRFQGTPVTFLRLTGCTRKCSFCDTKYHLSYREMTVKQLLKKLPKKGVVVVTGGEPLIQIKGIKQLIDVSKSNLSFHLESNGDLIERDVDLYSLQKYFDYVCISPKELKVAKKIHTFMLASRWPFSRVDIKVVTDATKVNKSMIAYATMLMPLTTYNRLKDSKIRQKVWNVCCSRNLSYSARLHVEVWGQTKKR